MAKNKERPQRDIDREKLKRKNQDKKKALNIRKRRNLKDELRNGK